MSIKIYDAYVINKELTLKGLLSLCLKIKDSFLKLREQDIVDYMAEKTVNRIDDLTVGLLIAKPTDDFPLREIWADLWQSIKKGDELFEKDFSFKAIFYPLKGKTLVTLHTSVDHYSELFKNMAKAKDYHYQNQCDRPKEISAKDWRKRRDDWEKALSHGNWSPSKSGFTFVFADTLIFTPPKINVILDAIPPFDDRVRRVARELTIRSKIKENNIRKYDDDLTEYVRLYRESVEWLETPEGESVLKRESDRVSTILKRTLTEEDLIGRVKEE